LLVRPSEGKKITHIILIFSCVRESLRLFGSFGFLRLGCGSAKTKCAYLRVGFFSMLPNVLRVWCRLAIGSTNLSN